MNLLKKITLAATVAIFGLSVNVSAQDTNTDNHQVTITIPTVALLDLEASGSKNITGGFTAPTEAGDKLTAPTDNTSIWLNYSSIVSTSVTSRRVDVKASATVSGVDIKVVAGACTTGEGQIGTPSSTLTLTTSDQELISNIGSAYTETGVSKGHQLTYSFAFQSTAYANLVASSTPVTVTYTLADN